MHLFDLQMYCNFVASMDSTVQVKQESGADWQEEIYQKVASLKTFP